MLLRQAQNFNVNVNVVLRRDQAFIESLSKQKENEGVFVHLRQTIHSSLILAQLSSEYQASLVLTPRVGFLHLPKKIHDMIYSRDL